MAMFTYYEANRLLAASFTGTAYTTATSYLGLDTANGSASAAGTEASGGSYARQSWADTTPSNGSAANAAAINYTGMPAATVTGVENFDAASAGNRKHFGALTTSRTTAAGDTLAIAAGALTNSLV